MSDDKGAFIVFGFLAPGSLAFVVRPMRFYYLDTMSRDLGGGQAHGGIEQPTDSMFPITRKIGAPSTFHDTYYKTAMLSDKHGTEATSPV